MKAVTVEQWKSLFQQVGLSEKDMEKWHRLFEEQSPQGHQSFLEWLGLTPEQIRSVRSR